MLLYSFMLDLCHNTRHNVTKNNDTQYINNIHNTQHNKILHLALLCGVPRLYCHAKCCYAECRHAECRGAEIKILCWYCRYFFSFILIEKRFFFLNYQVNNPAECFKFSGHILKTSYDNLTIIVKSGAL